MSGLFRRSESERFQTRLAGFNDTWTPRTTRNDIAFTNLEGGPFRFEVRNVDRQGQPGPGLDVFILRHAAVATLAAGVCRLLRDQGRRDVRRRALAAASRRA